jgi:hypothetical protein
MIRALELARCQIEQRLIERGAVCDQIDVRLCETGSDLMAYVYCTESSVDDFVLLIETANQIDYFDARWIEMQLWPRLTAVTVH